MVTLSSVNPAHMLHVIINLFNTHCLFLIDTGAAVTLINDTVWKRCQKASACPTLEPGNQHNLTGVDGSPLQVLGAAQLLMDIGGTQVSFTAGIVTGISEEGILGLDFLTQFKCTIDLGTRILWSSHGNMLVDLACSPTRNNEQDSAIPVYAILKSTVVIPARSEMEVMAGIDNKCIPSKEYLIENHIKGHAVVARGIIQPQDQNIVLRVVNPTLTDIKLYQGMKLATVETLSPTEIISTANVNCKSKPETHSQILWQIAQDTADLNPRQKDQFYQLLLEYSEVFAFSDEDMGRITIVRHKINTGAASPVHQPPRWLPVHTSQEVKKLVGSMLQRNVIEPSTSPWSSPVVLVKKCDGSFRFCVDYRRVNSLTRKDAYPLLRINESLETLSGSKWFQPSIYYVDIGK